MKETTRKFTLRKTERLGEKKIMDELFLKGESIRINGMRLLWKLENNGEVSTLPLKVKAAFSVPKKIFKSAVKRNVLKRRMREAYRKNKLFSSASPLKARGAMYLIFIYTDRKVNPYTDIESKIVLILQRLEIGIRGKEQGVRY